MNSWLYVANSSLHFYIDLKTSMSKFEKSGIPATSPGSMHFALNTTLPAVGEKAGELAFFLGAPVSRVVRSCHTQFMKTKFLVKCPFCLI